MIREVRVAPLKRLAIGFLALLSPSVLFAQGCAMCYQTAAGSGAQFIQALRHGILIMFFPPILLRRAIFYAPCRKRNQCNSRQGPAPDQNAFEQESAAEWTLADQAE